MMMTMITLSLSLPFWLTALLLRLALFKRLSFAQPVTQIEINTWFNENTVLHTTCFLFSSPHTVKTDMSGAC